MPLKEMSDKTLAESSLMARRFQVLLYAVFRRTPEQFLIGEQHLPQDLGSLESGVADAFRRAAEGRNVRSYEDPGVVYDGTKLFTKRGVALSDAEGNLIARASSWTQLKQQKERRYHLMARFEFGMRGLDDYDKALGPVLTELWHLLYPIKEIGGNGSKHYTTIYRPSKSEVMKTDQAVLDHVAQGLRLPNPY